MFDYFVIFRLGNNSSCNAVTWPIYHVLSCTLYIIKLLFFFVNQTIIILVYLNAYFSGKNNEERRSDNA